MYTRNEVASIKKAFWVTMGKYMAPIPSATGLPVNWLNYKTGVKDIHFRMDANKYFARVSIEITHPDATIRQIFLEQFESLNSILHSLTQENWQTDIDVIEDGRLLTRIGKQENDSNIYNESDWPKIISFLKPRILTLDAYWAEVKDIFIDLNK